ncbi:MAG: hypothetical protein HRU40_07845 [Saprospiraceae bacterium]|nr:hypothetical protein [Saprospiraceae bacterium]
MAKNKKKVKSAGVHEDLSGFHIRINEFGEIVSSKQVDELNAFLNENVADKKLRERKEIHLQGEEE